MKYYSKKQWTHKLTVMVLLAMALGGTAVQAMPSGGDIRSGQGSISQDGKNMTVLQNSDRMAIDWTKFDIAKDETVRYAQPNRNSISLNRVTGGQQSVIAGNLNANGNVVLVNPNGVVFTKNSSVDVGGLVASTARLNDEAMKNFGNGKDSLGLSLDKDSTASVINEGQIKAQGGLVALHAANVENKGTITNEGGTLAMAAAKNLTLSAADDDKLNFTVDGDLAKAQALNSGSLKADGGYVVMTAKSAGDVLSTVVNNSGTIEAKTLRKNEKGQILLDGGDNGQVEVSGTLDASGTEKGQDAGNIKVIGQKTIVHDNTNLLAKGDNNGGKIETSGDVLDLGDNLNIDASGDKGSHGTWLLDPLEVVISDSKPSSADHEYGTIVGDTNGKTKNNVIFNDPPSKQNANNAYNSTTWIDSKQVGTILAKGTDVIIQAISTSGAASITLSSPIDITVDSSASKNPTFTLEANRNITINQNITAESGGKGLNIMLNADTDGDGIGAVIINADIATNGGNFTSVTGGKVTHTSNGTAGQYNTVKVGGAPAHEKLNDPNYNPATVGTYFGGLNTSTKAENRSITTNGGAITLNGEVAIGLNGGTLTLDTGGGDLTVTGLINSGNSYKAYIYGTDDWNNNKMIQEMVDQYLKDGTVPAYHYIGITYDKDENGNLIKDGNGYKWSTKKRTYADGANNIHYVLNALTDTTTASGKSGTELSAINPQWYTSTKAGEGYDSFIVDKASTITVDEYLAYVKKSAPGNWQTKYNALTLDAIKNDTTKMATLKSDIAELIAHNWFLAEQIAENGTKGGANVGDSYLATITTRLENSLSTPNGQHTLWVGGRGSGVRGRTVTDDKNNPATWGPSDPTLMDGFYWVTGPEGAASTYKDSEGNTLKYDAGIKFWDTASSDWNAGTNGKKVYGLDPTWSTYTSGGKTITQPDNNGPFLTVGYGSDNQWDDANFGGETTWGFVQETNLANSSLKINTGKGAVNLKGDIGKGQALDTLNIEGGTVQIGDRTNTVTDYNNGTVYVDHGLKITGTGSVTVGGEIHSGESPETDTSTSLEDQYKDNVTIQSGGNLEVHGITSNTYDALNADGTKTTRGGKIKLTSTGTDGKITLGAGVDYDGHATAGTLAAASADKGAVVVDAQGSQGSLVNSTTGTDAITTGTTGTWQVYVNSPSDYGTSLGSNLKSGTNAQWTAKSNNTTVNTNSSSNTLEPYTDTSSNKFIFQVTPVITISGGNQKKIYGETLTDDDLKKLLTTSVAYTDSQKNTIDVTKFSDNFKEDDYLNYISSLDGKTTGINSISTTSDAAAATATRTVGDEKVKDASGKDTDDYKTASDGNRAFYVFNVDKSNAKALNGYDLETVNGDIEILKRTVKVNENGHITYGSADGITYDTPTAEEATSTTGLKNGDTIGSVTMTPSTAYQTSQGTRHTADAGNYDLTTDGTKTTILNNGKDVSANYDISGSGTLIVDKATLTLDTGSTTKTYGDATGVHDFLTDKQKNYTLSGFVNGDQDSSDTQNTIRSQITSVTNTTKALVDNTHTNNVLDGGNTGYAITTKITQSDDLKNYNVVAKQGNTVTLTPVNLTINGGMTQTYGNTAETVKNPTVMIDGKEVTKLVNGDTLGDVSYAIQSDGNYNNSKGDRKTADAGEYSGEWITIGAVINHGDLTNQLGTEANGNYIVTGKGNINVEKATLTVNAKDITETYGNATGVLKDAKTAYEVTGFANGDDDEAKKNALENQITVKMDATDALKDNNQHTKDVNTEGYNNKVVSAVGNLPNGELSNYTVAVGTPAKVHLTPAEVHLKLNDVSTTYGTAFDTDKYGYDASKLVMSNGDDASVVTNAITNKDISYNNTGAKTDATNKDVKTANAGDDYKLTGTTTKTLNNYKVVVDGAKATVNKANLVVDTTGNTRTYGDVSNVASDVANAASFHLSGSTDKTVNGDTEADILKELGLSTSSDAQVKDDAGKVIKTGNANTNPGYDIKATFNKDLTNYTVSEGTVGKEKIEKATLHLSTGDYTEAYGNAKAVQNDLDKATTVSGEKNGDSLAELTEKIGITNTTVALLSADRTKDVKYKNDGETPDSYNIITNFNKSLDNYKVVLDKAGTVTLTPKEITIKNTMTQQYGSSDRTYKEATVPEGQLVNGDSISTKDLKFDIKSDGEYAKSLAENQKNSSDAITADAGPYTGELIHTGGGITHADGSDAYKNYKVTVEGDIIVTPAPLTITTKDVTTEYGTVKETTSTATGLVNGDQNYASDISYDYGDYGHGYLDNNTRTNNVGSYDITTKAANTTGDFLKNYTISGGDATLTITPKDVYFHVDGKGSTFDDIIYTVTDPSHPGSRDAINSQLPYGETVTGGYGLGRALPDTPGSKDHYYTVDSTINGTPVYDNNGKGTQVGNYVYHPTGQAVIHFDQPQKPDQTTHYVEGARRPQDKIESALPVFRVDASGVVKQYGTYGIESKNQAVTLSPTGMRMPEPNQPSTQDRKYLTTLKTAHGHGTFRLEYNGVVLRVIPVDPAAEQIVTDGDKMKNVALSEQALHVAYTQMGLDLVNLKGVYIYMAPMSV